MRVRGLLEWAVGHFKPVMIVIWCSNFVLVFGAIIIGVIVNANPNATIINLSFAPSTATVKIDGEVFRSGSYELAPGAHHIDASAEGFNDKSFDVEIKNNKSNDIAFYLENESEGLEYYERSDVDLKTMRIIAKTDDVAKEFIDEYDRKYGLIIATPFKETYFAPDGYTEMVISDARSDKRCKGTLCILISGYKANDSSFKMQAVKMLSSRGYDINDYEVFYEYK